MNPYYQDDLVTIYHDDCRNVLPELESVEAVITDPPYGLDFMGRGWDRGIPGIAFWIAIRNAMKPGAYLLAFSSPRTHHRLMCAIEDAGFEIPDCLAWFYGKGYPKSRNSLKPAWEPIIFTRKKREGTLRTNVERYGVGELNIEGTRIEYANEYDRLSSHGAGSLAGPGQAQDVERLSFESKQPEGGRWPANVILTHSEDCVELESSFACVFGCPVRMLDDQTGMLKSGKPAISREGVNTGSSYGSESRASGTQMIGYGDAGGASRFFYCTKASRKERNYGLPEGLINEHSTVKPVALMRWLVRLVTPPNGIVLDPFMGSGSTNLAARAEGFQSIGIDQYGPHCEVASKRKVME